MLQYDTYTVYLRGFESVGSESGLSLANAFRRVLSLAGCPGEFETRGDALTLVFRGNVEPIMSRTPIESDAVRELMLAAVDGRFGFAATLDADFLALPRAERRHMTLDASASRFLLRAAIKDKAHRFPGIAVPQRGHAKAGFDLGLAAFSAAVAERLHELGIVWTRAERP